MQKRWWSLLIALGTLVAAACGGVDLGDAIGDEDVFGTPTPTNEDGSTDIGGGEAGPVTVTADPAQTWVEVDGERIVYEAVGAIHYECSISDEQVSINYQRDQGQDLLIQGGPIEGEWVLNLTFTVADQDNVVYGATIPGDGSLGLGDNQLSYEGPIDRVEDRDIMNPTSIEARIATNCSVPEGEPTAVIDGSEYVISMVGADSVRCEVSDEMVTVQINRLTSEGTNIDIGVETRDEGWFGHVAVTTPDGRFMAKGSPNPAGLQVDGSTVSYEGTFEGDTGDVEGSLAVSCP